MWCGGEKNKLTNKKGRVMSQITSGSVRAASLLKALQMYDDEVALMDALQTFETRPNLLNGSATLSLLKTMVHRIRTFFQLRGLMVLFLRKMTAVMEEARKSKTEQNVFEDALRTMKDFWSLCSNQQQVLDPHKEFGSYDSSCFEVLPSLASVYLDLAISVHSGKDSAEKAFKRLHSLLLFDLNTRAAKAALLEVTTCTAEGGRMLAAILRRLLWKWPAPLEDTNLDYLLHMLLLKRWAPVCPELEDIVRVNRGVKAPAGFVKWLCLVWPEAKDYVPEDKSLKGSTVSRFLLDLGSETVEPLIDVFSRCIASSEEQTQEKAGKQKKPGKHKTVNQADVDTTEENELSQENISKDLMGRTTENTVLQPGSEDADTPTAKRKKAPLSEKKKGEKSGKQAPLGFQVDRRPSVKIMEAVDKEESTEELKKSGNESRKRKKSSPGRDIQGSDDGDDDDEVVESVVQENKSDTNQRKKRKVAQDRDLTAVLDFQIDRSSSKKVRETAKDQEPGVVTRGSVDEDGSTIAVASGQTMVNGKSRDKEDEEEQEENDDDEEEEDDDEEEKQVSDEEEEEVVDDADEENDEDEVQTDDGEEEEEDQDMVDDDDDVEDSDDEEVVVEQRNFTNVKKKDQEIGGQEPILGHFIDRGGNSRSRSSAKETKTTQSPTKPSLFSTDPAGHYFVDRGGQHGKNDSSQIQVIETSKIHVLSSEEQPVDVEETTEKKKKNGSQSRLKTQALRSAASQTSSKSDGGGSEDSEESEKLSLGDSMTHDTSLIEEEVGKKLSEIRQSLEADAGKGSVSPDNSVTRRTPRRKLRSESEKSSVLTSTSFQRSRCESEKSLMSSSRRRSKSESEEGGKKATRSQKQQQEDEGPKDAGKEGSAPSSPSQNLTEIKRSQTPGSKAKRKEEVESVLSHWLRKPTTPSVATPSKSKQTSQKEKEEVMVPVEPRNSSSRKRQNSGILTGKTLSEGQSSSPEKVKSPGTLGAGMANGAGEKEASVTEEVLRSPVKTRTRSAKGTASQSGSSESEELGGKDALSTRSYNLRTPVKARGKSEVTGTVEKRETVDTEQNPGQDSLEEKSSKSRRKSMEPKQKSRVSPRVTRRMSLRATKL